MASSGPVYYLKYDEYMQLMRFCHFEKKISITDYIKAQYNSMFDVIHTTTDPHTDTLFLGKIEFVNEVQYQRYILTWS